MASAEARERYARKNEGEDLRRAFAALDRKGDGKLDADELCAVFDALGHRPKRGEVDDLIWEVDEDCDGAVSWAEFQRAYHRCRQDAAGVEPRGLFNVAEFVMNDRDGRGVIGLEDAARVMYLRHGRAELDARLEEVFGTSDLNSGRTLGLTEFLRAFQLPGGGAAKGQQQRAAAAAATATTAAGGGAAASTGPLPSALKSK